MKIFRKMTALLFVAATMFTFASCEKNNDDNLSGDGSSSGISETNLIGEWGWQSSHVLKNKKIIIYANHTGGGNLMSSFNWTLKGSKFVATFSSHRLEMTIKSINGDKMEVEGEYQLVNENGNVVDVVYNVTGTLIKTVTTQSPTLTTDLMVGQWSFQGDNNSDVWNMTVFSDGTYNRRGLNGNWTVSGSTFNTSWGDNETDITFVAESMKSSASKIELTGTETLITGVQHHGKLTKNL